MKEVKVGANTQIVVQLKSLYSINSFEGKLKDFPQSSTIKINRENYDEAFKEICFSPLFTSIWLVYINGKLTKPQLTKLIEQDNLFIVLNCNSKSAYEDIKDTFKEFNIKYSFVDNSTAEKSDLIMYCMESLSIDEETARYLCKRQNYIMNKVVTNVLNLATFDKVDKKVIQTYTTRIASVGLLDLVDYLLGVCKKKSYKSIVNLLYNYRYGFSYVLDFTKTELRKRLELYDYIKEGELTLSNYKEFIVSNKIKMNTYFVYRVLEDYKNLSYDKLYLISTLVESIPDDRYYIYKYIELLKMGG